MSVQLNRISAKEVKMCVDIRPYNLTNVDPVQGELDMGLLKMYFFMCFAERYRMTTPMCQPVGDRYRPIIGVVLVNWYF